jgi:hypothetical protein
MSDDVGGPTVSLAEAAGQSALSLATIRRRLKSNKIPGAVRNGDRSWSLPIASLVAEGIWTGTTEPDSPQPLESPAPDDTAELTAKVAYLTTELRVSEAVREQLEGRVEDLRTSMRMLEAGPQRRRRWFRSAS